MSEPLQKPHGLNWNAAGMQLPDMPMVSAGADAMSATIAGVLPTMAAELTASVAALGVKENMFSGKLTTAESQYNNADDQGGQAVGQLTDMLGKVGDMAKSAAGGGGGSGGGGGGIFSSLMEQAMKMAEGMGGKGDEQQDPNAQGENPQDPNAQAGGPQSGGPGAGGQAGAGQASGGGAAGQAPPSGGSGAQHQASGDSKQDERGLNREARPPADAAAPGESQRGAGPAPVAPHEPTHRTADDDLKRRL